MSVFFKWLTSRVICTFSVTPFKTVQQSLNRYKVQNLGEKRSSICKAPRQDSGYSNYSQARYTEKYFTQIFNDLAGAHPNQSCSSSRKVTQEWLAALWEYNRTNDRNNAPSPKTITAATMIKQKQLTTAATLLPSGRAPTSRSQNQLQHMSLLFAMIAWIYLSGNPRTLK